MGCQVSRALRNGGITGVDFTGHVSTKTKAEEIEALLKHVDAPCSPGGACVQSAAGGRRLSRPCAALDEAAFVPKAPLASGTTSAEKRSERPNMLDGDTKGRRRGKRGGQKRRDAAALRTKLLA